MTEVGNIILNVLFTDTLVYVNYKNHFSLDSVCFTNSTWMRFIHSSSLVLVGCNFSIFQTWFFCTVQIIHESHRASHQEISSTDDNEVMGTTIKIGPKIVSSPCIWCSYGKTRLCSKRFSLMTHSKCLIVSFVKVLLNWMAKYHVLVKHLKKPEWIQWR